MILVKGLQRYQRSKLEVKKNICRSARLEPEHPESAALADIFFELQLWPLISLQPFDQNQCLVPQLKDLLHVYLEIIHLIFSKANKNQSENEDYNFYTFLWFVIKEIGRKICEATGEKRLFFYLFQNISMAIGRGNVSWMIGPVPALNYGLNLVKVTLFQ